VQIDSIGLDPPDKVSSNGTDNVSNADDAAIAGGDE
jgi:hypothetical protein